MDGNSSAKKTENGVPIGRHANLMLPSLRAPRDLTLGGSGRGLSDPTRRGVKRTFAPNIAALNVKKEKLEAPVETETVKHKESSRDRGRAERGFRGQGGRGRGQGRGQNIVYQKSIFEEWSNVKPPVREGSYRFDGGGGGGGGSFRSQRTSVDSVSSNIKVKEELQDMDDFMKNLLRDDFIDDDLLATTESSMFPVVLNAEAKEKIKETIDAKPSIDGDVRVKEEVKDVPDSTEPKFEKKLKTRVPWNTTLPESSDKVVFTSVNENKKLFFIQLPGVLPGFPSSTETVPSTAVGSSARSKPSTADSQTNSMENCRNSLGDFTEGFLGKMRVRRSGKVELELGNVVFEGIGLPSKSLQEVVVCEVEPIPKPKTGDMTIIGHISHKINFAPQLNKLLFPVTADSSNSQGS